ANTVLESRLLSVTRAQTRLDAEVKHLQKETANISTILSDKNAQFQQDSNVQSNSVIKKMISNISTMTGTIDQIQKKVNDIESKYDKTLNSFEGRMNIWEKSIDTQFWMKMDGTNRNSMSLRTPNTTSRQNTPNQSDKKDYMKGVSLGQTLQHLNMKEQNAVL
ncbi:MAG: hypothetical protein EZS28_028289, partial [Streblomastix strix]